MTPRRAIVLALTLVLAALIAVGAWGQGQTQRLSDDDYISIAISQPEVFHPTPGGGRNVSANVADRGDPVIVDVVSDGQRFRVFIDPRTNKAMRVIRQ